MARTTLTTDSAIQHDGGADTFLTRQGESLRHWAAPRIEAALAWGEHGTALGGVGAAAAAEEGRRRAKDATQEYVPVVREGAERAGKAVAERYGKVAPAVTAGLAAVAPAVQRPAGAVQDLVSTLQEQAKEAGHEFQKEAAAARKDAEKKAEKARKDAQRKAKKARRHGHRTAEHAKAASAKGGLTAAGLLATAASAVKKDDRSSLLPQVQERLAEAARYAGQRREELAPVAAARLADVAGTARQTAHDVQVPAGLEQALIALTGDRKIVAKLRKGAEAYAGQTEKSLKRTAGTSSRSGGRGWILAGMATAAAGAGFAVWKLTKPVQDPWAAPVPGPITANIPVVQAQSVQAQSVQTQTVHTQTVQGSANPYAKQQEAVAEANAQVLGQTPRQGVDPMVRPQDASVEPVIRTQRG